MLFQSRAFGWRSSHYATYARPASVSSQLELKRTANQRIQSGLLKLRHWSGCSTGRLFRHSPRHISLIKCTFTGRRLI